MFVPDEFADTVSRLQRSTVQVRGSSHGGGSGIIWREDGLIVTNAHVAPGRGAVIKLADGRELQAQTIAHDADHDLAALRVEANNLPAVTVSDSSTVRVGQVVAAVGNPLGLVGAVSVGIIHALGPTNGEGERRWVQADVRLAPGNSGGPLAAASGAVIGVNSMVAGGLGLAVPSNLVQRLLATAGERPRFGIAGQGVTVQVQGASVPGLLVLEVAPESPAEAAGLLVGDILIGAARELFSRADQISTLLRSGADRIELDVLRGGRHIAVEIFRDGHNGRPGQVAA